MPANPLIALQGKVPDIGQTFSNILLNVKLADYLSSITDKREREKKVREILIGTGKGSPTGTGFQQYNPLTQPNQYQQNQNTQEQLLLSQVSDFGPDVSQETQQQYSDMPEQTQQEKMLADQEKEFQDQQIQQQGQAEQKPIVKKYTQDELIAKAKSIDPEYADKQLTLLGLDDKSKREEASRFAAEVLSLPPGIQNQRIMRRVRKLESEGRNPSDTLELLKMTPDERIEALQGIQMLDLSTKERFAAQSDAARAAGTLKGQTKVQSSEILPDGTSIQIMSDGKTRVTNPEGDVLDGKERSQAIRKANEYGINLQQLRAQGRKTGEFTAKTADDVIERVDKVRENNDKLRELITAVKGGAKSGPLINRLPTLTAASQRLENIKNRLGLDVVGSVTFGALSEKELELAKQTAVPNLPEKELIQWAQDKLEANEKLAGYLEEQAIFLSEPGRTRADWLQEVRRRRKDREAAKKQSAGGGGGNIPKPQTQADYDNLPSGTIYIDPEDNKQYRKP